MNIQNKLKEEHIKILNIKNHEFATENAKLKNELQDLKQAYQKTIKKFNILKYTLMALSLFNIVFYFFI